MSELPDDFTGTNTIPAIDRMMDVLTAIEARSSGMNIGGLAKQLELPRTSVYRIVNTLQKHEMIRRDDAGNYHLGRRLLKLASHVALRASDIDMVATCQPHLDRLASELGEGVKLSVMDNDGVLVLATAQGRREYALTVAPGQRMPIHAGAASKLLLAHADRELLDYWLSKPLVAYTNKTVTDPKRLRGELTKIRRLGWARDKGENAPSIHAFAAPVMTRSGRVVAALSIPFLAGTETSQMEEIRMAAIDTAAAITSDMPE